MMLNFQRNKLVSIAREGEGLLNIHGVLEDHIFALELDVVVDIEDLKIHAIKGKWNRQETPECHRAVPFLQEAVGQSIGHHDFSRQINKMVGRKSCPHYANLLIECCDAAVDAVHAIHWEAAKQDRPALTFEAYLAGSETTPVEEKKEPPRVAVEKKASEKKSTPSAARPEVGRGFVVDLHVHSFPASPCSSVEVDRLIQEAKRIRLDAVCLTDHNHVWTPGDIQDLTQKHGFLVLRGNEITTDQGDMLVYGMHQDVKGIIKLAELKKRVEDSRGFMIAAHPFRGFLVFNTSQIGLTAAKAMERPVFQLVNAVEVLNGKVTQEENAFAKEVAAGLGLPMTGGSDAHDLPEVGKYATCFAQSIQNETDLLEALRQGRYVPCEHRKTVIQSAVRNQEKAT